MSYGEADFTKSRSASAGLIKAWTFRQSREDRYGTLEAGARASLVAILGLKAPVPTQELPGRSRRYCALANVGSWPIATYCSAAQVCPPTGHSGSREWVKTGGIRRE
jgi:hypothetical protein